MDLEDNPFLQAASGRPEPNPFLEDTDENFFSPDVENPLDRAIVEAVEQEVQLRSDGKPRSRRPDGSYYSSDSAERHAQLTADGKIGPQFGALSTRGKKERSRRAAEAVAEFAKDHADAVRSVFRDGIDPEQPQAIRLQTVKQLLDVEREEDRLALQERQAEFEEMNKDQLVEQVRSMFDRLSQAGQISGEIIESTAVEVPADDDDHG